MPTRSELKMTCLAKVGLATYLRIFFLLVRSEQPNTDAFPHIFHCLAENLNKGSRKRDLVKEEASRTLHKLCSEIH